MVPKKPQVWSSCKAHDAMEWQRHFERHATPQMGRNCGFWDQCSTIRTMWHLLPGGGPHATSSTAGWAGWQPWSEPVLQPACHPDHLVRLFRRETGRILVDRLRTRRVERAQELLVDPEIADR
jgi:hypothetical protein